MGRRVKDTTRIPTKSTNLGLQGLTEKELTIGELAFVCIYAMVVQCVGLCNTNRGKRGCL